ncbi:restriction endonuclease subunit S [Vreelandella alkaliphila]|uniref:restriction endonuclease subunit S n=1 Tax=Vreelandella alkaliphila TaxID=272774 RepID=UPI000EA348AF|nr:restriction endonuclease subunit S [Halomonas alkaliphila]AYF33437.1 restriction endonuclease subunit S [Halomonas alkaliphila]
MSKLAPLTTEKIIHFKNSFSFPNIWCVAYAQFAFNEVRDGTHDSPKQSEKGVPLITSKNLTNGFIDFTNTKIISLEDHLEISKRSGVSTGDLLFSMIGTIGNVAPVPENTHFSVKNVGLFRKNDSLLNRRFSFHWLRSHPYQKYLGDHKRGGNQKFVSLGVLRQSPIPIPPLCEQKVIADKLDTLLAQVENTKARLERIPQILKRFRQSVLAAAVSGRLTEEWRSGDTPEQDFKKLGDAGVTVKTGPFGSALHKSDYVYGGIPVINPMHISEGIITPSESMTISQQKYLSLEAWHLRKGDIVVGRRGEMGRAAVVGSDEDQLCGTGSMLLRAGKNALPKYLEIILRSPTAVSYFNSASVGSTMVNLNQKVIKNLEVYFPPLKEQTEIVRRVDQLFAHADRIEQQVNQALAQVNNLIQSILAKAFRGELTEQWRKDNPELISGENSAEALLERIKAERAAKAPAKRTRKKATA